MGHDKAAARTSSCFDAVSTDHTSQHGSDLWGRRPSVLRKWCTWLSTWLCRHSAYLAYIANTGCRHAQETEHHIVVPSFSPIFISVPYFLLTSYFLPPLSSLSCPLILSPHVTSFRFFFFLSIINTFHFMSFFLFVLLCTSSVFHSQFLLRFINSVFLPLPLPPFTLTSFLPSTRFLLCLFPSPCSS